MTPVRVVHARSAAHAADLLRVHAPHAQPIAAGGDLIGLWKEGVLDAAAMAPVWVDLAGVAEMTRIEATPEGGWRLGAMATLAQLQRTPGITPLLVEAVAHIASPQLRLRTTVGGNLLQRPRCWYFRHPDIACFKKGGSVCPAPGGPPEAHPGAIGGGPCHAAHPSDLATALLALDATVEVVGAHGTRTVPMAALYRGAAGNREREAHLAHDEVLSAVHVPPQPPAHAFAKVAPRAANEFATAAAAAVVQVDVAGRIERVRIALGGVSTEPLLLDAAHALLRGQAAQTVDSADVARRLAVFSRGVTAATQVRATHARWAIEHALARAIAARR